MQNTEVKAKEKEDWVRRNHSMPVDLNEKVMQARGFLMIERKEAVNIEDAINFLIEKGYESLKIRKSVA